MSKISNLRILFALLIASYLSGACTKIDTQPGVVINTGEESLSVINQTITATSGSLLGYDVDMDNTYAIAGDPFHNDLFALHRGKAIIYSRTASGTTWTERATIKNPVGKYNDNFGIHVTIRGNYAASCTNDSIYVFKRILGDNWVQQAALYPKNLSADSLSVSDIDIYGDFLIVGHGSRKVNGKIHSGCVYFFKKTNDKWAYHSTEFSPNNSAYDRFGCSVSIYGNFAVIGSRGDLDGNHGGKAYAYINFLNNWNMQKDLTAPDVQYMDNYGGSVELRGDYAIIGASQVSKSETSPGDNETGSAYIFKRSGADWTQQAKIVSSDFQPHGYFGASVQINDNYALVGGDFTHDGAIYTFSRSGTNWNFLRKDMSSVSSANNFGHHLAMDSTRHYLAADYGFISFGTHY